MRPPSALRLHLCRSGRTLPASRPSGPGRSRCPRPSPPEHPRIERFTVVGDVFDAASNPERKQPFDMRSVMRAVADADFEPLGVGAPGGRRHLDRLGRDDRRCRSACWASVARCLGGASSRPTVRQRGPPGRCSPELTQDGTRSNAAAATATGRPHGEPLRLRRFTGVDANWQLGMAPRSAARSRTSTARSSSSSCRAITVAPSWSSPRRSPRAWRSRPSRLLRLGHRRCPAAATVSPRGQGPHRGRRAGQDGAPRPRRARRRRCRRRASGLTRVSAQVRSEKLREVADEFDGIHTIERLGRSARWTGSSGRRPTALCHRCPRPRHAPFLKPAPPAHLLLRCRTTGRLVLSDVRTSRLRHPEHALAPHRSRRKGFCKPARFVHPRGRRG